MGYDGSGGYTRSQNFSAAKSAGTNILASSMDTEFDDFASAMTLPILRDGRNEPTADLPMAGQKHINVAAAASATDYLRVREFVAQVPIYVEDTESGDATKVSACVEFYATVSATQAPPGGSRLIFLAANTKSASCHIQLKTAAGGTAYSANIIDEFGQKLWPGAIQSGGIYETIYQSAASSWQLMNPSLSMVSISCNIKVVDNVSGSIMGEAPGVIHMGRQSNQVLLNHTATVSVSVSAANNYLVRYSAAAFRSFLQTNAVETSPVHITIFNNGSAVGAMAKYVQASSSVAPLPHVRLEPMTLNNASVSADVQVIIWPWSGAVAFKQSADLAL